MENKKNSKAPILFVVFNRKDIALQAFSKIREYTPKRLYIAADGPRPEVIGEDEICKSVKEEILKSIDWDCEINTLFSESNKGCGLGVSSAIDWFFKNEEFGIILEDDCIASTSFFKFVEELLHKYKNDQRIGMIAGHNAVSNYSIKASYCFSKYKACWGWATWRRAWENQDINMTWLGGESKMNVLLNSGYLSKDILNWKDKIKSILNSRVSAWDWQWYFSLSAQNQLCIFPGVNLVSNIGFGENATHTKGSMKQVLAANGLDFPLEHPKYIVPDYNFDKAFYKRNNTVLHKVKLLLPPFLRVLIKRLFLK